MRIKAVRDGFRRCNKAHADQWVVYKDTDFTEEEWRLLKAEPMLVIEKCPKGFEADSLGSTSKSLLEAAKETDALIAQNEQMSEADEEKRLDDVSEKATGQA